MDWTEKAREFCHARGTAESFEQSAQKWREPSWSAEDCRQLSEEVIEWLASFASEVERLTRQQDAELVVKLFKAGVASSQGGEQG